METQYLKYFVEVSKTLNFSRAAKNLNVSQPSLSAQVKILEDQLGVSLFVRSKRSVQLTREGANLYPKALGILNAMFEMTEYSQKLGNIYQRKYSVALTPLVASSDLFTRLLKKQKKHPGISFQFFEKSTTDVISCLKNRQVDFALMPMSGEVTSSTLFYKPLVTYDLVKVEPMHFQADKDLPFISFHEGCGMRYFHELSQKKLKFKFENQLEATHADMVKNWVKLGLGWTILPENTLKYDNKDLILSKPKGLPKFEYGFASLDTESNKKFYKELFQ